jgi:hypothetical protein
MNAEQIRKEQGLVRDSYRTMGEESKHRTDQMAAWALHEIAAQLAELNQNLRDIHPELNLPEKCRAHQCEYYLSYQARGERSEDMSHEAYHETETRAAAHFKSCSESERTTECSICLRYEKALWA